MGQIRHAGRYLLAQLLTNSVIHGHVDESYVSLKQRELTEGKGNYVQSVSLLSAVVIKKRNGACFE